MLISVRHVTHYAYAEPVGYTIQSLRLTPASFNGQRVIDWRGNLPGAGAPLKFKDGFGNLVELITINRQHQSLSIEAAGTLETPDCKGIVDCPPSPSPPRRSPPPTPHS